ncbi:MAG: hypothetical protein ABSG59_16850 [Verrucomicrobiota bacterium]|jgi:hypothetical protein
MKPGAKKSKPGGKPNQPPAPGRRRDPVVLLSPRQVAKFNIALQRMRIGQLPVGALRGLGGKSRNTSWGAMEMFLGNRVAPDDRRKETVCRNLEAILRDIVQAGVNSGEKVILNTVAVIP